MPRYKLTIEYDGTHYSGWQRQPGFRTVEERITKAAGKFGEFGVQVVGAGRTDAGVHATGQVAHMDLPKDMDAFKVMQGLNYYLFNDVEDMGNRIAILKAERVDDAFHARFSAKKRHYVYRIINRRARLGIEAGRAWHVVEALDTARMQEAAKLLVGHHDFNSFRDTECQSKTSMKTLEQLDIKRYGDEVRVVTSARSFLHHQVRIMVGTLALVGKGRWTPEDVQKALEARHRTKAGPTAPAEGLYLVGVDY